VRTCHFRCNNSMKGPAGGGAYKGRFYGAPGSLSNP
jgi:hypothetical protein